MYISIFQIQQSIHHKRSQKGCRRCR